MTYPIKILPPRDKGIPTQATAPQKGGRQKQTTVGVQSVKSLARGIHTAATKCSGFQSPVSDTGIQSRSGGFLGYQRLAKNSHPFGWRTGPLLRSAHINTIKPLSRALAALAGGKDRKFYDVKPLEGFSSMDIETITLSAFDNLQIPVVITSYS